MFTISKDTLWKGIIEDLFADFLLYFFPQWATQHVDFTQPFEFLDKELAALFPSQTKKRNADKSAKVFLKNGTEQWILIHIEVQGYKDEEFAEQMSTYFYRIKDRFGKKIMALAILTDDSPDYRPNQYVYEYEGTKHIYQFPIFKLLDKSEKELNVVNNPFSIVLLTARQALERKRWKDAEQLVWKRALVRALRLANYDTDKIRRLLDFISYYVSFNSKEYLE